MNIALWIVAGIGAALFLMAGMTKLAQPREKLEAMFPWVQKYHPAFPRLIGAAEVLGAIGLILPQATGIMPILTPIAGLGLALVMVFAAIFHVRRGEVGSVPANLVLMAIALFVAIGRLV